MHKYSVAYHNICICTLHTHVAIYLYCFTHYIQEVYKGYKFSINQVYFFSYMYVCYLQYLRHTVNMNTIVLHSIHSYYIKHYAFLSKMICML